MSLLEALAVLTGAAAVYLSVRENPWTWPVGLVNAALYAAVFAQAKLYADAGLQGVYAVLSVYGAYQWLQGGADRRALSVSRVRKKEGLSLALAGTLVAGTLALLLRHTDASLPALDSGLTGASLVAQWMMARKLLESWAVWIAVDVLYVGMFVYKALFLTAGLYALFLVLAVMGHRRWRRALERT